MSYNMMNLRCYMQKYRVPHLILLGMNVRLVLVPVEKDRNHYTSIDRKVIQVCWQDLVDSFLVDNQQISSSLFWL